MTRVPCMQDAMTRAPKIMPMMPLFEVMEACVRSKFTTDAALGAKLVATAGRELVEGNTWGDTYWGVCDGEGEMQQTCTHAYMGGRGHGGRS